jgi:hypothetical protein
MKLIQSYDDLFTRFKPYFKRTQTFERARALAFSHLITYGRHTISRIICTKNEQHKDWSADYKFFSQRQWDAHDLFFEVLSECDHHSQWYQNAVLVAIDETFRKKTGKKIPFVRTLRDPMSLPYHTNLAPAIRFLQAACIINPQNKIEVSRAIPFYFEEAAPAKKPTKNAPEELKQQYKREQKEKRITVKAKNALKQIRHQVDKLPNGGDRLIIATVDGSFCNRHFLRKLDDNVIVIARARKDLKLFKPFEKTKTGVGRHRIYGDRLPTPEQIRRDDSYPWKTAKVYAVGKYHNLRYKAVSPVLWQTGTGSKRCQLIIIAPLRYRKSKHSRLLYRDPAYLLVTDLHIPEEIILQYYVPRWDIEVNHRDEKSLMGLGDAQLRSAESVERNPQFSILVYSLLLLSSIDAYGAFRTDDYLPLPKWRKQIDRRPSTLDILSQFRREVLMAQLEIDLTLACEFKKKTKNKRNRKTPRSLIEAKKRGFILNENDGQKPLKLPVNILSAILYADS